MAEGGCVYMDVLMCFAAYWEPHTPAGAAVLVLSSSVATLQCGYYYLHLPGQGQER